MANYLDFSLGPVQPFINQARRTRDFWSGSFILSWLSAVAVRQARELGGAIDFPQVDEDVLEKLSAGLTVHPRIPPRFKIRFDNDAGVAEVESIEKAVMTAWRALADAAWKDSLAGFKGCNDACEKIWRRQIDATWDMTWTLSDDAADAISLSRAKMWRTHQPPTEPGIKCMAMGGWQALADSKHARPRDLKAFWAALRSSRPNLKYSLREGEHLCAIAFVKRRFAYVFDQVDAPMPGDWRLLGGKVPPVVPSVSYIAAAPWLARVLAAAPEAELDAFLTATDRLDIERGERATRLKCIEDATAGCAVARKIAQLDGGVFFDDELQNPRRFEQRDVAQAVRRALRGLQSSFDAAKAGLSARAPGDFYAVLAMDGDRMSKLLLDPGQRQTISKALVRFSKDVDKIVAGRSGFAVYSAGEDVLALLPIDEALGCAVRLREQYTAALEGVEGSPTISAGVLFVHMRVPLASALDEAHRLLDDIAKTRSGRDSLAVAIRKPGGRHLTWHQKWDAALEDGQLVVEALADKMRDASVDAPFAENFFFEIRELIELVNPVDDADDILGGGVDEKLLLAEYLKSGIHETSDAAARKKATAEFRRLVNQSRVPNSETRKLAPDAPLLVRFLTKEKRWLNIEPSGASSR